MGFCTSHVRKLCRFPDFLKVSLLDLAQTAPLSQSDHFRIRPTRGITVEETKLVKSEDFIIGFIAICFRSYPKCTRLFGSLETHHCKLCENFMAQATTLGVVEFRLCRAISVFRCFLRCRVDCEA